jgi:hypothetical protein
MKTPAAVMFRAVWALAVEVGLALAQQTGSPPAAPPEPVSARQREPGPGGRGGHRCPWEAGNESHCR